MGIFELTEWPVFTLTVILTVAALFFAVVIVPRRRAPGLGKHVIQFVCIILVTVLTLLTVFFKLNSDNQWYSSWGDLLSGGDGGTVTTTEAGYNEPSAQPAADVPHSAFTAAQINPQKNKDIGGQLNPQAESGQWATFSLKGGHSGVTQQVTVWLPPSYFTHPDRAYPVITAFTGFPGAISTYTDSMSMDLHIRNSVRDGKIREPIVVIPNVFPGNNDTECLDSDRGRYETFVSQDVVDWIRTNLRPSSDPKAWSTFGYSAGGWCSSMFAVRHPDIWNHSVNLAGYFAPEYSPGQPLKVSDPGQYDLAGIVAEKKPDVNMWFFSGGQDTTALKAVNSFKDSVADPTSLSINISETGGHRVALWGTQIEPSLEWLGRTSPYFGVPAP